ncbi:MAG: universal stress protein, partial [Methanomicrobiales archaeon]|nr:universal stress protein [Methanomicrobiales archaeon]
AFETAVEMAKTWSAEVHVVYVIETSLFSSIPMDNTWEVIYGMLKGEGETALRKAKKKAVEQGITIKTHIKEGHAGNEILRVAQEAGADMIVVGSHGKTQIDRLLLGSVSSYVVKYSTITTMVVRG